MDVRTTPARLREAARQTVRDARLASGPTLRLTRRAWQFDAVVALPLGIATIYYGIDNASNVVVREIAPSVERVVPRPNGPDGMAFMVTLAVIASGALALRRRYPLAVLCIVTAATLATPQSVMRLTFYAFVIAVYDAAVYSPYRVATLAALPVSVVLADPAQIPMVSGVLMAAAMGTDTVAWRDQFGQIAQKEALVHSFVLWLLADLFDSKLG